MGGSGGMAEPDSLVRLETYRRQSQSASAVGTTWWDRHGLDALARDQHLKEELSRSDGPDTVRLRPTKIDLPPDESSQRRRRLLTSQEAAALAAPSTGFRQWSTAYVLRLVLFDAFVWPLAVAGARGYDRKRIGISSDEMRSVLQAGLGLVVVGAFWTGLLDAVTFLKLAVVGAPFAAILSLIVRFFARKQLHWQQRAGTNVRRVLVVGGWAAARHLRERVDAEATSGMRIIGACIPTRDTAYAHQLGMPVLGNLNDVAQVVRTFGCDAVAITSDDATRHHYLRRLAWSLEGTGVEMFVDPGLVEVAGPRMHIRPQVGLPLLHIEEPHFTGWRRVGKRAADMALSIVGLVVLAPLMAAIAVAIKLEDGGPVLFRQTRIGRNGTPF